MSLFSLVNFFSTAGYAYFLRPVVGLPCTGEVLQYIQSVLSLLQWMAEWVSLDL